MTGGLFDPLGMEPARPGREGRRRPFATWAAGLLLAALAVLLAVAWLRDDGGRGHPVAVAPIGHVEAPPRSLAPTAAPSPAPTGPPPVAAPTAPPPAPPSLRDDPEVEIQNGVRIIRPRRAPSAAPGGQTVPVDPSGGAAR